MPYVPYTGKDIEEMLQAVGAKALDDQFRTIPEDIRLKSLLNLPSGLSEQELTAEMKKLAGN
ncbi:MAG: glycine dehydrogenase, partial [Deltaproteobacteria bacterium]|nr:glycine dehydrogenase [Deltaproteobacteria bacterium]